MQMQMPNSERQRYLPTKAFAENSIITNDIPRDSIYKSITVRLSGSVVTTFASGTPVADAFSTLDNLVPRIDITVDGSRTVKSQRPFICQIHQMLVTTILAERKSSAAAAAATGNYVTADGGFVYGTTGQVTTVAESCTLTFENWYANSKEQRDSTLLNLKGASSAEIRLTCAAFAKLLGFANTAPVVYTASTFTFEFVTREAMDIPGNVLFGDYKQTTKSSFITSESVDFPIEVLRGNHLQGIMFLARDGAAGSTTTASGKLASNLLLLKIQLMRNGQEVIKSTTFANLQTETRMAFGVSAPFASNVSRLDGVAYMNLLQYGDLRSALDARPPLTDNLQLLLNTNTAANVSYTNSCEVTTEVSELVWPR